MKTAQDYYALVKLISEITLSFLILLVLFFSVGCGSVEKAPAQEWKFTCFGTSVGQDCNLLISPELKEGRGGIDQPVILHSALFHEDGSIEKKGGKFVADCPADGASYYYTTIDPAKQNFILQADVRVDQMNPAPDGQEGFALMVRDTIEEIGTGGNCLSNLISVSGTRLPDGGINEGTETTDLIGFRAFTGIYDSETVQENSIVPVRFGWNPHLITQGETYRLKLEKNDYSYIASQFAINEDGTTGKEIGSYIYYIPAKDNSKTSVSGYDELDDPVRYQDKGTAYVALAAARGMNVTFSNISFCTSDWNASNWRVQPTIYMKPVVEIISPAASPEGNYDLVFKCNADGKVNIWHNGAKKLEDFSVKSGEYNRKSINISEGFSKISVEFTPDPDYRISAYEQLSDYSTQTAGIDVSCRNLGSDGKIYVSASGNKGNKGESMDSPVDIQTALDYVDQGQTILLAPETYKITDALTIAYGRNGSSEKPVTLTTSGGFATIDFKNTGKGFFARGNYWNMSRINITRTADKATAMMLTGSYNTLERMNFYNNGNSGLLVSASTGLERIPDRAFWPEHNLIRNCTSMNNSDSAMEDADGFAPKLACGEGNVFEGCIAAYNADDGWDLFAKIAYGTIGKVTVKDSVAYKNGYIKAKEGSTKRDFTFSDVTCDENGNLTIEDGIELAAGNGNGFKMGGSNMPGGHSLSNCVSFNNRKKGIDANSCPNIILSDCVSYNNEESNVALYTENMKAETDYQVDRIISFRDEKSPPFDDKISLQNQDEDEVFSSVNYYCLNEDISKNSLGEAVSKDWFVSLDTSVFPTRLLDGSLDLHGLLQLKTSEKESFIYAVNYNNDGKTVKVTYTDKSSIDFPVISGYAFDGLYGSDAYDKKAAAGDIRSGDTVFFKWKKKHQYVPLKEKFRIDAYIDSLIKATPSYIPAWNQERFIEQWNYIDGVFLKSMIELYKIKNDISYMDFVRNYVNYYIDEQGNFLNPVTQERIELLDELDSICASQNLFDLMDVYGNKDSRYEYAIENTYDKLMSFNLCTNNINFEHKAIYPSQIWLDGMYMYGPFLARYANYKKDFSLLKGLRTQYEFIYNNMRNERGLYLHAMDTSKKIFWADKNSGLSKNVWLRSMGWLIVSLTDVIGYYEEGEDKEFLLKMLQEAVASISSCLDQHSMMYFQLPALGDSVHYVPAYYLENLNNTAYLTDGCYGDYYIANYLESSGSSMLAYSMMKSARLGYIDNSFAQTGLKTFEGICENSFDAFTNSLSDICITAGLGPEEKPYRDSTSAYYLAEPVGSNDAKGIGPFIMAYLEYEKIQ